MKHIYTIPTKTHEEANKILLESMEFAKLYGYITLSDIYNIWGEDAPENAENIIWKNLNKAKIVYVGGDGYRWMIRIKG